MKYLPWLLLVVVAVLYGRGCAGDAETKAQIATLQHANDSLLAVGRGLDTVYVARTDTLKVVRHRTDSILTTDTLWSTDTVRVLVETERRACDLLVATCEEQKQNLRAIIYNRDSTIILLKRPKPFLVRFGKPVLPFLGGMLVGSLLHR